MRITLRRLEVAFFVFAISAALAACSGVSTDAISRNAQSSVQEKAASAPRERQTQNLTIPEGYTIAAMMERVRKNGVMGEAELAAFEEICRDGEALRGVWSEFDALLDSPERKAPRPFVLEGYLFPETYNLYTDTTGLEVATKLLKQTKKVVEGSYAGTAGQEVAFADRAAELNMTTDQILTIASLLQKESGTADFAKVSAVIHLRLQKDMLLGLDAAVQYASGTVKVAMNAEDLAVESPYNVYKVKGLPPGPICAPSREAIQAALFPDQAFMDEGFLYYCSTDPTTSVLDFSKTYEEHEEKVQKYRPAWQAYDKAKSEGKGN